ncbi:helix-turn-helix domain-containing protein [Pseudaestuariivita rosea]|uniref:helix-turn-helix domain-containing protein n=2 Tax=Pseudaestuariivita rosea TaxID=2763263 RepID=UPI001ABB8E32|nr:helix-turn-helix domain-containing protein [Pseudaestuariivita rosea]
MPKSAKLSGIKSLRCYTIQEAAGVTGGSDRTIRAWIKQGLPALESERPTLVRGNALISFIEGQRQARKSHLSRDEFYCLKCRAARKPAGALVDCETDGARTKLTALCEACDTIMHKPITPISLSEVSDIFDVTMRSAPIRSSKADHETNARNRH